MDNRLKYGILIVAGGVGIYIIWKGGYFQQWFPSLFGTTTPTPTPTPTVTTPKAITAPQNPPPGTTPPPNPNNYPPAGTQSIVNGATYQADGKGGWVLVKAAPSATTPQSCPPGQVWSALDNACVCIDGSTNVNGVCQGAPAPTPKQTLLISQQMVALAGSSTGLSMDQWCYYFTAVTGNACPFDPGDIQPQEFNDAGVHLDDGTIGDRTTPTDIGTWLAFVNLKAPGSGISGLAGLAALHVANAWLT